MSRSIFSVAGVALLIFAGCQVLPEPSADPTRTYVLNGPSSTDLAVSRPAGKYQIGIRSIELPGYLRNHRDMAVRAASNEIKFQEFSRWAESLEDGVNRILKQNLISSDIVSGVSNYPFATDVRRDFDLVIRILGCEGAMKDGRGYARFVAAYEIVAAGGGGEVLVRRTFTAPELPWDGKDYGNLAALLSEGVAKLSEDIAANLPK